MKSPTLALAAALLLPACSSPKSASSSAGADAGFAPLPASDTTWTMKATVPASQEIFKCQYVTMPATAEYIVGGDSAYTVGSHHLLVYETDLTSIPAGETAMGDCYEGTAGSIPDYMNHVRGVVYGAQQPTFSSALPAGVGIPFAASAVMMVQVHYLNATGSDYQAEADVHLDVATSGITTKAGVLFFYDPFIDVPAGGKSSASMRCPIPQSITILGATSHYHARGVSFRAYVDPPSGAPSTSTFYTSADWQSPGIMSTAVQVAAGSHIRYYCDYDNTTGTQEYVQGPSAANNEMCMFIGAYYPAMTNADEQCQSGDTLGTGTATCSATVTCLGGCPANDAGAEGIDFNECIQKCMVQSCPNVTAAIAPYLDCFQTNCATACAGQTTSAPSQACTSCVAASCPSQYQACASLTGCD